MKAGLCVQNNIIVVVPWLMSNCLAVLLETSTFVHLLSHRKVRTLLNSYQNAWQNNYALIKWVTFSDLFLSHLCFHIFHGISSIDGSGDYQHYIHNISTINIICRSTVCLNFTASTWKQNPKLRHQLDRQSTMR